MTDSGSSSADPLGDPFHIEPPGLVIERGNAHEEERRAEQVHDRENCGRPKLAALVAVPSQHIRRDHGDFEENIEIEGVRCQENTGESRAEQQHQRRERLRAHPVADLEGQCGQQYPQGEQREGDAQHIGVQSDAHPGVPIPGDHALRTLVAHLHAERSQRHDCRGQRRNRHPPDPLAPSVENRQADAGNPENPQPKHDQHGRAPGQSVVGCRQSE